MQHYHKLVRDRIPDLIRRDGRTPDITVLNEERFHEYLDDKIEEELAEYRQHRDHTELMDVVEVIQALVECEGSTWERFERDRAVRRQERGGFGERIWLKSVR